MIEIGKVNKLVVSEEASGGFYLRLSPEEAEVSEDRREVFMPNSFSPLRLKAGEEIDVFVYLDTQSKLIATSEIPFAQVGEYAYMRAIDVEEFGAFFDWGIDKDLLVPGNEQKVRVKNLEYYLVRVCLEEGTDRVYGTTKLGKYIESSEFDFDERDVVKVVPVQKTDLGHKVIINKCFIGLIYDNETFKDITIGNVYDGIVKKIRVDGLVDISLQPLGVQNLEDSKDKIILFLEKAGGQSSLNDKSSPEEIQKSLGMSKKTFKSAIGMLFKEKKIEILKSASEKGIKLISKKS
ncbi:MAG: hypothetical protein K9K67_10590 [Bacteriovoracaceae bacterium]|nr:hypothetical protein [Bacteriovoracaceae bacterium]